MNLRIIVFVFLALGSSSLKGQAKIRKMPPNINHTSINNFAPYISLDGNSIVFIADVAEDNLLTMCYSARVGVNWNDPITLPKNVNTRLNFFKGFGLSADGKTLYTANARGNSQGGFDLYTSQLSNASGTVWTEPLNMGPPINSKANEACASVSVEGNMMFFMRCEKMDFAKADNCKIMMVMKKPNGQWDSPVELPAIINSGNSQAPRIMGDSETLIFSSNKIQPNKGGMDLYMTRYINDQWSAPIPLDFANTPQDDEYVSASSVALGRYLMKEAPGTHFNELVEVLFPPELRPRGTMKIEGTVTGPENLSSPFVTVFDMKDQRKASSTKPGKDGVFISYLKEGGVYDLSVEPEKDNFTFFSKTFDLTGDKFPQTEKVSVTLKPAANGDEIALDGISFKPSSAEINPSSTQELRRLTRLMQGNPDKFFSIMVTFLGYQKDSVRSNPDLTEVIRDTLKIPITYKVDSITTATRDSIIVKTTYHNNRTLLQAKAIGDYLVKQGIPSGRLSHSGKALEGALVENRKTLVKVTIP